MLRFLKDFIYHVTTGSSVGKTQDQTKLQASEKCHHSNMGPMDPQRMEKFCGEIYEKTRHTIPILGPQYGNGKIRQKYKHQKNDPQGTLGPQQAENFLLRCMKQTRYTRCRYGVLITKNITFEKF